MSAGSQIAQTAHAVSEFALTRAVQARRWRDESNSLVVVAAPSEAALEVLAARARDAGLDPVEFREPDMGDELTAVLLPGSFGICGGFEVVCWCVSGASPLAPNPNCWETQDPKALRVAQHASVRRTISST